MSAPQNIIAIVYDYDQTLSPSYMQDEVVFPAFGINSEIFWRRCASSGSASGATPPLLDSWMRATWMQTFRGAA